MLTWLLYLVSIIYITCGNYWVQAWEYVLQTNTITICKDREENNHILYHELWHFVFFQLLSDEEQQQWYRISRTPYISKYASMSVYEDFAEEFRDYSQKNKRKNNLKRSFIKKIFRNYITE